MFFVLGRILPNTTGADLDSRDGGLMVHLRILWHWPFFHKGNAPWLFVEEGTLGLIPSVWRVVLAEN